MIYLSNGETIQPGHTFERMVCDYASQEYTQRPVIGDEIITGKETIQLYLHNSMLRSHRATLATVIAIDRGSTFRQPVTDSSWSPVGVIDWTWDGLAWVGSAFALPGYRVERQGDAFSFSFA